MKPKIVDIKDGREVIAHAGVVDRLVRFGSSPARAAGIQNVFVPTGHDPSRKCKVSSVKFEVRSRCFTLYTSNLKLS